MANTRFTGTVTVRLNGKSQRSAPGATIDFGGLSRKTVIGDGQLLGWKGTPMESKVTATFEHCSETDVDLINGLDDGTLSFECDSGVSYLVRNAFSMNPPKLTGGDSSGLSCEFGGQAAVTQKQ